MKKGISLILAIVIVFALAACGAPGGAKVNYWPKTAPDAGTVNSASWELDIDDIGRDETIISVSPSGKHILTASRLTQDMSRRFESGVANHFGLTVEYIAVYTLEDGEYNRTSRIRINRDRDPELNDTLAVSGADGVAWSEDETRALVTVGLFQTRMYMRQAHANIYLVDFAEESFERLTETPGRPDGGDYNALPQWVDDKNIMFVRMNFSADGDFRARLTGVSLDTGEQSLLADLSADGRVVPVFDYVVSGDNVYFNRNGMSLDFTGLFVATMDGGVGRVRRLVTLDRLREREIHPYASSLTSVQISQDGRWACLTVYDNRLAMRDFPFRDDPVNPQPDPASAHSVANGQPWVPCHNVLLYDLENDELVDPFTADELAPDVSVAIGATLAPDGKSLLCAVLGDGGVWRMHKFFTEVSVYQIRLDDESFDAVKVFETKLDNYILPDLLSWLGNNSLLLRSSLGPTPTYPVQIVKPAAFGAFDK